MTELTIQEATGPADTFLHIYPGQEQPQGCFLALDLRTGEMHADFNGEVGNDIPFSVWHGLVRRYAVPVMTPEGMNALMREIGPLAQRVLDGAEIRWNGTNMVGRLSDDGYRAEGEIESHLDGAESDLCYWRADIWLAPVPETIYAEFDQGRTIESLAEEYQGNGTEDAPHLVGLTGALELLHQQWLEDREESA